MHSTRKGIAKKTERSTSSPLAEVAYHEIRRLIISVTYRPGAVINEAKVSEELGIGRTPVHQAFLRLAHEGFVDIIPRKGIMVRAISLDEVAEIIEARLLVEPYCASVAASRASERNIRAAQLILDATTLELEQNQDPVQLMELDRKFHTWLADTAGNAVLAEILQQLHARSSRFWVVSLNKGEHPQRAHEEHKAVLNSIAARDSDAAKEATTAHIKSFRNTILGAI